MRKDKPCLKCPNLIYRDSKTGLCTNCYRDSQHVNTQPATVELDRTKQRYTAELASLKHRYEESLQIIDRQERELRSMNVLKQGLDTFTIEPKHGSRTSEGTVVIVASDWHVEENVGAEVGGLNTFNIDIAKSRAEKFFQNSLRLIALLQQDITINTVVLALLGDFVSSDIHDEIKDLTEQLPMQAIVSAQNMLISGIEFLLKHSTVKLIIPCHSGNHARTTKTTRFGAENGHSIEYLMYLHLATYFRQEPRITFIVPESYHSYLDIYGYTIRFHHGHMIKYGGGIGGVFIPTFKAISQWSKARRADLDVFGHFHQMKDGGNFLSNGSLIGYSSYALSIKSDFEKPRQLLFLIDKRRGRTCTWPILVE